MLEIKNVTNNGVLNFYLDSCNPSDYCSPDTSCGPDYSSCGPNISCEPED